MVLVDFIGTICQHSLKTRRAAALTGFLLAGAVPRSISLYSETTASAIHARCTTTVLVFHPVLR